MKIAMVAGGTGGHIYPAIALAEGLKAKGHTITFFGSNDRMEKEVIPNSGFDYIGLNVVTTRGGIFQKIKSLLSIEKAYFECLKLLKGYDLAIGFGNYISVPVMNAAIKLGLKTALHEQNSFVGRANRLLDKKVDLIVGCYEENRKQFKNPNLKILGNPQASKAYLVKKDPNVLLNLGLKPDKKTVVIFMGSLGSSSVHEKLKDYFNRIDGSYQVVYATGKNNYDDAINSIKNKNVVIKERIDGINVMKNADLLISRGGATTLAEINAIGIASIIIPSPYVPNNHQYYNAKALVDLNAATMIEEKDLSGEILNTKVNELIFNDQRLKELSNNALKMGNQNVIEDIINSLESL